MTSSTSAQETGFVVYPSSPAELSDTIQSAAEALSTRHGLHVRTWEQNDIAGRFLADPIFEHINDASFVVADVTRLNFNVAYEVGYAIGCSRRLILIRNAALTDEDSLVREVGIYDTLGYRSYKSSDELVQLVRSISDMSPLFVGSLVANKKSPIYIVLPRDKTDVEIRITSRIKKARLQYRSFDPQEQARLSAADAIQHVAQSMGIVIPLLSSNRKEHRVHNLRAAFVAGLAAGMQRPTCLLQFGNDPVPLDYRDLVQSCSTLDHINRHITDFVPEIMEQYQYDSLIPAPIDARLLEQITFGQPAAENEFQELSRYYLEIDEYLRTLRGEVQIVTGRKGSGKTAMFGRLREHLRKDTRRVVLDLKPEGYQLLEFVEVLKRLSQGSREHVISAFWEYLLLLEVANKLIQKDHETHVFNHDIRELYRGLRDTYLHGEYVPEGDFAERLMTLTARIAKDYETAFGSVPDPGVLTRAQLSEMLYKHDIPKLLEILLEYLQHKDAVWILFDNLDKGWPAHGVTSDDLAIVRGLMDAMINLRKRFHKHGIACNTVLFLRNDVYELLLDSMPDRGKIARANLDWTDPNLLRELLRRRLLANEAFRGNYTFNELWAQVCETHIDGDETSQYLIDRSLRRPRGLLELLMHCRSHAVNLGHAKINREDIINGEEVYSTELVQNIDYEIRDVFPQAEGVVYELLGENAWIEHDAMLAILQKKGLESDDVNRAVDFLLWYGVLGIVRDNAEPAYIYDMQYSAKRMRTVLSKQSKPTFQINPAFWAGLEVKA